MTVKKQAVEPPKSSPHIQYEQLAYVESFDAVVDKMYALVVYKETKTDSGKWVVRIKASVTAGTAFDPDNASFQKACQKAAGHDEKFFVWGFNLTPKGNDPRLVENRVMIDADGNPASIEVHLITRKADGSAREEQVATAKWPE